MNKPIWEASIEEIRERAAKRIENSNEVEIDYCILSVYSSCLKKGSPVGNLLAALNRKPYTTRLLPITYYSIDPSDREALIFECVIFTEDFGPFKSGDVFDSVHLHMDGSLLAFCYDFEDDNKSFVSCDVFLQVNQVDGVQ